MNRKTRDKIYSLLHKKKIFTKMPLVSVIIPLYNYEKYVVETIDSVLNQTYTNWELIIVDDCSKDNSYKIVSDYISNIKNSNDIKCSQKIIILQNEKNLGNSSTRNVGIKQASGEYIVSLDADDYFSKYLLEEYVYAITTADADIVYCDAQYFQNSKHKWRTAPPTEYRDRIFYRCCLVGCSMFRKIMWEKVGGYNETQKSFDDWDFWIKCNSAGYKNAVKVDKYLFYYRKHGFSISDDAENKEKMLKAQVILDNKNSYPDLYIRWANDIFSNNTEVINGVSTREGMPLSKDLQAFYGE